MRVMKDWKAQWQAQVKINHRATVRANITCREKGVDAMGENDFLSGTDMEA